MWIRMLTTAAGPSFCHRAGDVVEIDDELAKDWIHGRHAEHAKAPHAPAAAASESIEETAAVDDGEKAVSTGSTFKKLTGAGKGPAKGSGKGKGDRGGNPSGATSNSGAEPDASDDAAQS